MENHPQEILEARWAEADHKIAERKALDEVQQAKAQLMAAEALGDEDLIAEAKKIVAAATGMHKLAKEAYGKASESLRLYYSYELGVKKEITSFELIQELRRRELENKQVQECLNLCGLVEFAKYKPNKRDFTKIVNQAKELIK